MRRFGSDVHDLDVDFTSRPPFVVTELLWRCAALSDDAAWDLPVGARTEAVVILAALSAAGSLAIVLRCPNARCGEALEIEIEPAELRAWCAETERNVASVEIRGRRIELRRPTGRDQRAWLDAAWRDAETAHRTMLATLLTSTPPDDLDAETLAALDDELARIDPMVGFRLTVACPACGESTAHTLDLARHALAALRQAHERLLETLVRLAARFHWTEAEIFALPPWRRERYLALADAAQ